MKVGCCPCGFTHLGQTDQIFWVMTCKENNSSNNLNFRLFILQFEREREREREIEREREEK